MSVWEELKRRNVFKVAVAYLVASWLIVQVVGVLTEPLGLPDVLDTVVVVLLAIGFPFALIIAWIYDVTPEGIRVTSSAGDPVSASSTSGKRLTPVVTVLFILAIGLMAVNRFLMAPLPEGFGAGSRLAILPCTDLSPDPSNAFFAPGIHQELITQLNSLSGLDVIAGSSVQQYAASQVPAPQVAAELQVQAVMECSATYSGDQVRLTMLLVDGATASSLWSRVYPADMSNLSEIFQIQADIAMNVASALRVEFLDSERERIEIAPTESRDAYELYLAARALNAATGDGPRILDLLNDALNIDANFAEAWSAKAQALSTMYIGATAVDGEVMLAEALDAAERAIRLTPSQGGGYAARAQVLATQHDWVGAARDYQAARERAHTPNDFPALFLLSVGYANRARDVLEQSLESDRLDANSRYLLMISHEMLADSEAADAMYRQGQRLFEFWLGQPAFAWIRMGRAEVGTGYEPVFPVAQIAELNDWLADPVVGLEGVRRLAANPENQRPVRLADYAILAAYFEAPEFAIQLLEGTSGLLKFLVWLPVFDDVRQEPAFKDLLRDTGLVEYWQTYGWPDFCSQLDGEDFICS